MSSCQKVLSSLSFLPLSMRVIFILSNSSQDYLMAWMKVFIFCFELTPNSFESNFFLFGEYNYKLMVICGFFMFSLLWRWIMSFSCKVRWMRMPDFIQSLASYLFPFKQTVKLSFLRSVSLSMALNNQLRLVSEGRVTLNDLLFAFLRQMLTRGIELWRSWLVGSSSSTQNSISWVSSKYIQICLKIIYCKSKTNKLIRSQLPCNLQIIKDMNKFGNLALAAGLALVGVQASIFTVFPGENAVVMDNIRGLKQQIYTPGFNFRIPVLQKPIIYDCKLKPYDINVSTGTKDLQTVSISLRILQQPIFEALPTIHQLLGRDYEKKVFNSIGQEILRTVVAQYDADQLLKNREIISRQIRTQLLDKAKDFNINVEDVSFMHLGFSREYAHAIERRAVQQQMAERQKFIVLRDEELKTAQIIRSEAEAEAAKLINTAVEKFGYTQIQIKKLEAAQAIAQLLSKNPNISFVPSNMSGNLLNLKV